MVMPLYIQQSVFGTAVTPFHFFLSASGCSSFKLSDLPGRIAQMCTHLELLCSIPSSQLDRVASLSNLTCLKLLLRTESDSHTVDHARLVKDIACLRHLDKLKLTYLAISSSVVTMFSKMSSLRSLHIMLRTDAVMVCDFQKGTQPTSINFSAAYKSGTKLLLPVGDTVSLQKLKVGDPCDVFNMGFATKLKRISISPDRLESSNIEWPQMLPNLQDLTDDGAERGNLVQHLPSEWAAYTNLTRICLNTFIAEDLPAWFSNLQQLQRLDLEFATFPRLPSCLSRLSGLQSLNLAHINAYLPADIVGLASLPTLTSLEFGYKFMRSKSFTAAERLHLKLLELHLWLHKPLLKRYGDADSCDFGVSDCNILDEDTVQQIKSLLSEAHDSLDMHQLQV